MKANKLFEKTTSDSSKDGGFIFQAQISHNLSFEIRGGNIVLTAGTTFPFDKTNINAKLHQVDLFPDLKTTEGNATLTYVILSEVNTLSRKFELASEVVKREIINPFIEIEEKVQRVQSQATSTQPSEVPPSNTVSNTNTPGEDEVVIVPTQESQSQEPRQKKKVFYRDEVERYEKEGQLTRNRIKELNAIFFKDTSYKVKLSTDHIFLREVSTDSLDSGNPSITLKISTSLVDEAFGSKVPAFENFKLSVSGNISAEVKGAQVAKFEIFDPIEKNMDRIFQTILPSLVLSFTSDRVPVETFSNKSSEIAARSGISYDSIFKVLDYKNIVGQEEEEDEEEEEPVITVDGSGSKKKSIEQQIQDLSKKIDDAEKELLDAATDQKKKEVQYKLDELKKKLEGAKKAYSDLGESFYVKQQLLILEKELNSFYQQYGLLLERKANSRKFY